MKVTFRGHLFDERTVDMIRWAEAKAGFQFSIAQGSYSTGVAASAGTHSGGGAVDFSVRLITLASKRNKMLNALKDAGFAAWYRTKAQGFSSNHIHAIAIGCSDLAPLAKSQVLDYDADKDGLRGHNADPTYRPSPKVKFDLKTGQPISREKAPSAAKTATTVKAAAPAKKAPAKKAPAKKAAPAKKTPATKPPVKKAVAKKTAPAKKK